MWCVFIVRREVILVFIFIKIEAVKQNRRKFKKKKNKPTKKQDNLNWVIK